MTLRLLAIDTSTEACSAAIAIDHEIRERYEIAPRTHAKLILGMIDELLAEAGIRPQQLDGLAFGRGPGAFTGVRIATGVVQGIAFGADLPVIPVSSLAALAQDAMDNSNDARVLSAIDARMNEVYWCAYRRDVDGYARAERDEAVSEATVVSIPGDDAWVGIGTGWGTYRKVMEARLTGRIARIEADVFPRARAVARLGMKGWSLQQWVSADQALPVYLRNRVVQTH